LLRLYLMMIQVFTFLIFSTKQTVLPSDQDTPHTRTHLHIFYWGRATQVCVVQINTSFCFSVSLLWKPRQQLCWWNSHGWTTTTSCNVCFINRPVLSSIILGAHLHLHISTSLQIYNPIDDKMLVQLSKLMHLLLMLCLLYFYLLEFFPLFFHHINYYGKLLMTLLFSWHNYSSGAYYIMGLFALSLLPLWFVLHIYLHIYTYYYYDWYNVV
jgi:hypothetical protein